MTNRRHADLLVTTGRQRGWIHVGLGPFERAEVRVQWPDGEVGPWTEVVGDNFVDIGRDGDVVTWSSPHQ